MESQEDREDREEVTGTANGLDLLTCRVCGCTEANPCETANGPCHWVDDELCSECEGRRNDLWEALVELAVASEYTVELAEGSRRFRAALDVAWGLVDAEGDIQAGERQLYGCAKCRGPIELGDDLCGECAAKVPEVTR